MIRLIRTATAVVGSGLIALTIATANVLGDGPPQIKIGIYSQNEGRTHASAQATINAKSPRRRVTQQQQQHAVPGSAKSRQPTASNEAVVVQPPPYPTLAANSPLAKNPAPFGPGTFWYQGRPGTACVYAASTSPLCYRITGAPSTTAPGVNPGTLAASVASRLDLAPGSINASPSNSGLTGATTWFWLDPAPAARETTVTLAGETVTVDATPTVDWAFGDGTTLTDVGPGRPYAPGPQPTDAITHTYQTRCLPGDQGHDPQVLRTCGSDGYSIVATVIWHFTYRASGPIAATGTVPARTTESTSDYPVSEARAFLVGAGR